MPRKRVGSPRVFPHQVSIDRGRSGFTFWTFSSPSERLSALGSQGRHRVAAARPNETSSLGIHSRNVPLCRHGLTRSLPVHNECALRPAGANQPVSFRPCGFSPLRRLTPRSGCQFVAPGYRQGFAAIFTGCRDRSLCIWHVVRRDTLKNVPVGSPANCGNRSTRPKLPANRTPKRPENIVHTSLPPKRTG